MIARKFVSLPKYFINFLYVDFRTQLKGGNNRGMVLIGGQEAMVVHNPALSFQVYRGTGCISFVPDHRPPGKTMLLE